MKFRKFIRHALHITHPLTRWDPLAKKILGKDEKKKPPTGPAPEDFKGELAGEMKNYEGIDPKQVQQDAAQDAQAAGTYSDTPGFKTALEGEAGARTRGLQRASMDRINALREKLNMPALPNGADPNAAVQPPATATDQNAAATNASSAAGTSDNPSGLVIKPQSRPLGPIPPQRRQIMGG